MALVINSIFLQKNKMELTLSFYIVDYRSISGIHASAEETRGLL